MPEEFFYNLLIQKVFCQQEKSKWSRIGRKCSKLNGVYEKESRTDAETLNHIGLRASAETRCYPDTGTRRWGDTET